jgi:hypothetical protein
MNWPEALSIGFAFIGMACMFHGFPDIHIGTKHIHNHYDREEE